MAILIAPDQSETSRELPGPPGHTGSRSRPLIAPRTFTVMDGRLILPNSLGVLERRLKYPDGYLSKAKANRPGIVEKHGQPSTAPLQ